MQIIYDHLSEWDQTLPAIALPVDRLTLAKRRWRGIAIDGSEFGFDLAHPFADAEVFASTPACIYRIAQKPETVLEVYLDRDPAAAARLGWTIGNLHFQLGVFGTSLLVPDDPALRQLLEREQVPFTTAKRVFRPLSGGHHH